MQSIEQQRHDIIANTRRVRKGSIWLDQWSLIVSCIMMTIIFNDIVTYKQSSDVVFFCLFGFTGVMALIGIAVNMLDLIESNWALADMKDRLEK